MIDVDSLKSHSRFKIKVRNRRRQSSRNRIRESTSRIAVDSQISTFTVGSVHPLQYPSRPPYIRRYGYTLRGLTLVCHRLLVRGKRFNAIVAMSSNGIVASEIMAQTVYKRRHFFLILSVEPFCQ